MNQGDKLTDSYFAKAIIVVVCIVTTESGPSVASRISSNSSASTIIIEKISIDFGAKLTL